MRLKEPVGQKALVISVRVWIIAEVFQLSTTGAHHPTHHDERCASGSAGWPNESSAALRIHADTCLSPGRFQAARSVADIACRRRFSLQNLTPTSLVTIPSNVAVL
jgi:hypothetical protein